MCVFYLFFFNDTATTEIYTLSLHDALPIFKTRWARVEAVVGADKRINQVAADIVEHWEKRREALVGKALDRKSTRLNSSHANISYAVFCLKKKKNKI